MLLDRISENLELRLLQLEDAQELFALTDANRNYLREWLPWHPQSEAIVTPDYR